MSVVVAGSANVDLTVTGKRLPSHGETVAADGYEETAGGKGLNQAVAAARAGAEVSFFYAVGRDSGAGFLADFLTQEPLRTHPTTTSAPTGRAFIEVDADGHNSIMVVGGANTALEEWPDPSIEDAIAQSYFLVLQQEVSSTLNIHLAALANKVDTRVVLTPAPVENMSPTILSFTDILILNEHEASLLGGHADPRLAAAMLSAGKTLILTRGASGATLFRSGEPVADFESPRVRAKDTTGAGDCFVGNFIAHKVTGASDDEAMNWACHAAALSVTRLGAAQSMPSRDELSDYLQKGS